MSAIVEPAYAGSKNAWNVRSRQDEEEERELARLRATNGRQAVGAPSANWPTIAENPLAESPLMDAPAPLPALSQERKAAHLAALRLGLEDHSPSGRVSNFTFSVRTALELMWEDISDLEERTERITRQAHLAMLVARVKHK